MDCSVEKESQNIQSCGCGDYLTWISKKKLFFSWRKLLEAQMIILFSLFTLLTRNWHIDLDNHKTFLLIGACSGRVPTKSWWLEHRSIERFLSVSVSWVCGPNSDFIVIKGLNKKEGKSSVTTLLKSTSQPPFLLCTWQGAHWSLLVLTRKCYFFSTLQSNYRHVWRAAHLSCTYKGLLLSSDS